ncbi:MAG: acyloxyacyl hydrolase [Bacteroidales bacterium]|nr:acyloxyacyl hydrolase [Bacteroidales bacterium]
MRFIRHLFILPGIVLSAVHVFSQQETGQKPDLIVESRYHHGLVIPFYDAIKYLVQDNAGGFELLFGFPAYGRDYWDILYGYPKVGGGYSCWDLGNRHVFGTAHALYGFFNAPVIRLKDKFSLNYQVSFGASILTKPFDVYDNYLNRAVGSYGNVYFRIGMDVRYRIFRRTELVIESGFSHFSSGKFKSPNYGLNALTGSLGINYLFGDAEREKLHPEIPPLNNRIRHSVIYAAGIKVYDNLNGIRYFITSLSYNFDWSWKHKRKLGIGADLFYDASIAEALAVDGVNNQNEANFIRFGIHGSYALQYRKLMMKMMLGHYLYSRYTDLSLVYSRLALQYLLTNHLMLNVSLKSHMAKADFIEWGIGYYW